MDCIIMTNTQRLAEKYNVSQQDVCDLINRNLLEPSYKDSFLLLDANDYIDELRSNPSWQGHRYIINDFICGMGLEPSPSLSLFIIGGDDVIPMPRYPNPTNELELLETDLLYCFSADYDLPALDLFDLPDLSAENAMCNVGRLPIENGKVETTIYEDLQSYFNLISITLMQGIEVNRVLMTSTETWIPASNEMIKGLPAEVNVQTPQLTKGNMYVSPYLSVCDEECMIQYKDDIKDADMMIFNLHGSDDDECSSFYGEGFMGMAPEAFSVDLLRSSNARVLNTVACYGARYIKYARKDSMLLSALYGGGVLLYAGSCTSAIGRSGKCHNIAEDILVPAGMSESFMKLYTLYMFKYPAGEAFLRAKCDYFNTCRSLDRDENALATILMFNLYGLPLLSVYSKKAIMQEAMGLTSAPPNRRRESKDCYSIVYDKEKNGSESDILYHVRSLVNGNLQKIRQKVHTNLYENWGIDPNTNYRIQQITNDGILKGYCFDYKSKRGVITKVEKVYTDSCGNVVDVIHFKGR